MRSAAVLLAVVTGCSSGCSRHSASAVTDAPSPRKVVVRAPVALRIARGIDTLSVELDPASRAETTVTVDPRMVLGVQSTTRVFLAGQKHAASERHGYMSGSGFDIGTLSWNTARDGIPQPGKTYVVEMRLLLFETDVPVGHHWEPRAGRFKGLLDRTIRQAEE